MLASAALAVVLGALGALAASREDVPLTCRSVTVQAGLPTAPDRRKVELSAEERSFARLPKAHTAAACFRDGLMATGWGELQVSTFSAPFDPALLRDDWREAPSTEQLEAEWYGAGLLEGVLTGRRIADAFENTYRFSFKTNTSGPLPPKVKDFLQKQMGFARRLASLTDKAAHLQLRTLLAQFDGLVAGIETWRSQHVEAESLFSGAPSWDVAILMNALGDLIDIMAMLQPSEALQEKPQESIDELKERLLRRGMCSALFRALPDLSEIVMGHTAWFTYANTNRIFKHYTLPSFGFPAPLTVRPVTVSFSSYAGMLESLDDFYMMSTGLVMIQTSLGLADESIYNESTGEALLAWQRVRMANAMASSGEEWARLIQDHNSGTYNNEYMVLDLNLFKPGKPLADKLLTVVDQIPGLVAWEDATPALRYGYFPSYNMPYIQSAFVKAGYQAAFERYNDTELTYELAPRGTVFRRDALHALSLATLKQVLGSNDYLHDPLAKGDPTKQVCARGDLRSRPGKPSAFGCYDVKVTNTTLARKLRAEALNGPTRGGAGDGSRQQELPVFSWNEAPEIERTPHVGLPPSYNFGYVAVAPDLLSTAQPPFQGLVVL